MRSIWVWLAIGLMCGCGDDGSIEPDSGVVDAGFDGGSDAGADAGTDAGTDTGTDAGTDAGADAPDASECVPEVCDGIDNDCVGGVDDGLDCGAWEGTGADGDLSVSDAFDLDAGMLASRFALVGVDGVELTLAESATGVAPGDEVLIINLRGDENDSGSVGHYETTFVDSVDGSVLTLRNELTNTYGVDGANDDFTGQSVMVMRVAHFNELTIGAAGSLTTAPFDGETGGVVFVRARVFDVAAGGVLDLSHDGYRGGPWAPNGQMGQTGESLGGIPETPEGGPPPANAGAGMGGISDCDVFNCTTQTFGAGGGGASYGSMGSVGMDNGDLHMGGGAGALYGDAALIDLFLGSGGGGGAGGFSGPGGGIVGGNGGGVIVVHAGTMSIDGSVRSDGQIGSVNNNCTFPRGSGGGGAGAGGSIWLTAVTMTLGTDTVSAIGGEAQCRGGGTGGEGRVRFDFTTLNGLSGSEAVVAAEAAATPDPGTVGSL